MSIRSHRPRSRALGTFGVAALAAVLSLSGCTVSDEQLRPGIAAQVGDTEVALDDVDEAIELACSFFVDQGDAGFPRSLARQQFVSALVQRAAAEQALAEQGLAVGEDYEAAVGGIDTANAQIPEEQRPPFDLLSEAAIYVDAASSVLGEEAFSAEGEVPADPAIVNDRGRTVVAEWLVANDVVINPVFRLTIDEAGQVVGDTTGTSVAASDVATGGLLDPLTASEEQVTAAAAQLPSSQLCGSPT